MRVSFGVEVGDVIPAQEEGQCVRACAGQHVEHALLKVMGIAVWCRQLLSIPWIDGQDHGPPLMNPHGATRWSSTSAPLRPSSTYTSAPRSSGESYPCLPTTCRFCLRSTDALLP